MPGIGGNIIGIIVNGAFISCEISATLNLNREMLPASAVDSAGWKEFISGVRDWNISVSGNLLAEAVSADIKSILESSYFNIIPLNVQFSTRPSATTQLVLSGNALFQSGSMTAAVSTTAGWTATLQGTGPLTPNFQDFQLIINAMPASADYQTIVDEGSV